MGVGGWVHTQTAVLWGGVRSTCQSAFGWRVLLRQLLRQRRAHASVERVARRLSEGDGPARHTFSVLPSNADCKGEGDAHASNDGEQVTVKVERLLDVEEHLGSVCAVDPAGLPCLIELVEPRRHPLVQPLALATQHDLEGLVDLTVAVWPLRHRRRRVRRCNPRLLAPTAAGWRVDEGDGGVPYGLEAVQVAILVVKILGIGKLAVVVDLAGVWVRFGLGSGSGLGLCSGSG